jgi:hypothetical protein
MPAAEAIIETADPVRYLARLCQHASQMGRRQRHHRPRRHGTGEEEPPEVRQAEWSGTGGLVRLNWGQWTMQAIPGALRVRAEAADEPDLQRIQDLITARLENLGRREHLTVSWRRLQTPAEAGTSRRYRRRSGSGCGMRSSRFTSSITLAGATTRRLAG